MKERPILFSAPMVRAILSGSKSQTRRVVHNPHRNDGGFVMQDYGKGWWPYRSHDGESGCYLDRQKDGDYYSEAPLRCPYGKPGSRLWVREAWKAHTTFDNLPPRDIPESHVWYMADDGYKAESRYRQGMFMPRWASRITLEVTGVRVERLHDISEADAIAEGVEIPPTPAEYRDACGELVLPSRRTAREAYRVLWEQINGPESWAANPWVWCVAFRRLEAAC